MSAEHRTHHQGDLGYPQPLPPIGGACTEDREDGYSRECHGNAGRPCAGCLALIAAEDTEIDRSLAAGDTAVIVSALRPVRENEESAPRSRGRVAIWRLGSLAGEVVHARAYARSADASAAQNDDAAADAEARVRSYADAWGTPTRETTCSLARQAAGEMAADPETQEEGGPRRLPRRPGHDGLPRRRSS